MLNPIVPVNDPFENPPLAGNEAKPSELLNTILLPFTGTMFQLASQALIVTTAVPDDGPVKLIGVGVPTTPEPVFGALVSPGNKTCICVATSF